MAIDPVDLDFDRWSEREDQRSREEQQEESLELEIGTEFEEAIRTVAACNSVDERRVREAFRRWWAAEEKKPVKLCN